MQAVEPKTRVIEARIALAENTQRALRSRQVDAEHLAAAREAIAQSLLLMAEVDAVLARW